MEKEEGERATVEARRRRRRRRGAEEEVEEEEEARGSSTHKMAAVSSASDTGEWLLIIPTPLICINEFYFLAGVTVT